MLGTELTAAEWLNCEFTPYIKCLWVRNQQVPLKYNPGTNTSKITGDRISDDIVMLGDCYVEAGGTMRLVITDAGGLGLKLLAG